MISTALVGCAHIHTPDFVKRLKARKDVLVKSVWDHDIACGQRNADELGARFFADVRTIYDDPEIKGVMICSETNRHEQLAIPAVEAKKHLFLEKPIGLGGRDANKIAGAVERAGVIFQSGYHNRSWPPVLFLREQVKKGTFGKITRARASVCHSGAIGGWFDKEWRWMADVQQAGVGAFGDLGTHGLDTLIWLFGDVAAVTATLDNGTARYPNCDETGEAIIRFKSGVISTLAAAGDDVANPVSWQISGTEAHAAIVNDEVFFKSSKLEGADGKSAMKQLPKGFPHPFELFLDALAGKDVPLMTVREAAYRCVVMEAIYRAARERTWISL